MADTKIVKPEHYFEVSWEVCNKVGGIHTVLSTKAVSMSEEYKDSHILIGPDLWRSEGTNPEFINEPRLLASWQNEAKKQELRIKVGRWNIETKPIVILIDFSTFIPQKDAILSEFWEKNKLDSLSGQWDYVEPVLFGYAAGKIIENFVQYHYSLRKYSVAHFHEWMTGSGLLYLKNNMPHIGTIFTTHATVLGRCIAGNNLPLYSKLHKYNTKEIAQHFNVKSKYSLEKCATINADVFTTVSAITAQECAVFLERDVDVITPNGFIPNLLPGKDNYDTARKKAREELINVAEATIGNSIASDAMLIGISGRYEFKNKGIDVFLHSLKRLKAEGQLAREIVAFILIPGDARGINTEVKQNLDAPATNRPTNAISTHNMYQSQYDMILQCLARYGLNNDPEVTIKTIFVPCYLNGQDGIFNMTYYNILIGLDLTVFPSYYEPWGYTPLESLAFKVPTITTNLAGFGLWVKEHYSKHLSGIEIIDRDDANTNDVINEIADKIREFTSKNSEEMERCKENAYDVSHIAQWDNLLIHYKNAFKQAINKTIVRIKENPAFTKEQLHVIEEQHKINNPNWISIIINRHIPDKLIHLDEISRNLWWCWNDDARELLRMIDHDIWHQTKHNPIELLDQIPLSRYNELENSPEFLEKLATVYAKFKNYMDAKQDMTGPGVAYLCMEYALHSSLKIYSGGLGVLAGDYLKEASDKGVKMTAIGLLYRYGYFTQQLSSHGEQESKYDEQDFMKLPITPVYDENNAWLMISLPFPGRKLNARIWRVDVGRVELYLLDTDFEGNSPEDRSITHHLYGGDWENRLKQEILLGSGGIEALRKLNIDANIYHYNEGHAAFAGLTRLKHYVNDEGLAFVEAMELVKSSSLFTTHTPVPAGHDFFTEDLLRTYLSHIPKNLRISWERFMSFGKIDVNNSEERFSMSFLAARLSQEINGVSWLHGEVSKDIFKDLWPGYFKNELHISYVTNGVHYPTWTAPEWKEVHSKLFGDKFKTHHYDKSCFSGIYNLSDEDVANMRQRLRTKLINNIKERIDASQKLSYFTPRQVITIKEKLKDNILTIGFARRFATYKRAHLLFTNLERLAEIVNNPERPVQFLFAGKAHPADKAGQDLIKRIVEISKMPQFIGRILFLPNYDMDLAKYLVSGVDVWMNTPTRPLEASGTSGEKAAMNGVMHFSVLDGWWVEGYEPDAGWMLPMERVYDNQSFQDELDSETIYHIIENEIVKAYYDTEDNGISPKWISYIKNTIAKVASNFTTNRMLGDYEKQYYLPMGERNALLKANDYQLAFELADWKQRVIQNWNDVEYIHSSLNRGREHIFSVGNTYIETIEIELGGLNIDEIGIELVISSKKSDKFKIITKLEYIPVRQEGSRAFYQMENCVEIPGLFQVALRAFPKHKLLPHRQDFSLVKWL